MIHIFFVRPSGKNKHFLLQKLFNSMQQMKTIYFIFCRCWNSEHCFSSKCWWYCYFSVYAFFFSFLMPLTWTKKIERQNCFVQSRFQNGVYALEFCMFVMIWGMSFVWLCLFLSFSLSKFLSLELTF